MIRILIKICLGAIMLISLPSEANAQTGKIKGVVKDAGNGMELIGVNVYVEGTTIGTSTDVFGKYELSVPAGNINLVFSFVSYEKHIIEGLKIAEGLELVKDVTMVESTQMISEFVVEAEMSRNTENAVLLLQKNSITIQDAVSMQEIKRSGSSNAAESVKQVTGISVVDGKHLVVRGLGDRYSYTQLNGTTLQSPDPYKNSAQLDLIPSHLLDNIITNKTFTPDQPGNFTGGNVNLNTRRFPDTLMINFSTSINYNPQSSFNSEFITYEGGSSDWLGFDDGSREMPEMLKDPAVRNSLNTSFYFKARNNADSAKLLDDASKSLSSEMTPVKTTSFTGISNNFSFANQYKVFGNPLGIIAGIGFKQSYSYYSNGTEASYEAAGKESEILFTRMDLSDEASVENPQLNGIAAISYKLHKNHELSLMTILNRDTEKTTRYLHGSALGFTAREAPFESRVLGFTERSLNTYLLNGKHNLKSWGNISIDWSAAYSITEMTEPDKRFFANEIVDDTLYQINASTYNLPSHFFRNLNDTLLEGQVHVTIPISEKNEGNSIKIGGLINQKDRQFNEYNFYYRMAPSYQGYSGNAYNGNASDFFGENNTGVIDSLDNGKYIIGNYLVNGSDPRNNYSGRESVKAAYAMTTLHLTKKTKLIAGVRMEHTSISVTGNDTTGNFCWDLNGNLQGDPEEDLNGDGMYDLKDCSDYGRINQTDFLPAISVVHSLKEDMNLRASVTKTLARPSMRELAAFSSFDFIGGFIYLGNPALKVTHIVNLDLRWEWFTNPGEVFAISGFYKHFTDPVVKSFNPNTSNPEILFTNTDEAEVWGAELEWRKNFGFISPKFENLKFSANMSYIFSRVKLGEEEYENYLRLNSETKKHRPFAGQSPYLLNASLVYFMDKAGMEIQAQYNVFGPRLAELGQQGLPDSYEQSRHMLGLTINKKISEKFGLRIGGQNLLDAPYSKTQNYKGREYVLSRYKLGPEFTVTISCNLP